ncbi:MAG TPA: M1 family aminopeptidase [Gemmatimonadales bacterium]|nr:M1 family aminopeptidase [Gemmatimonadales bacterium]
MTAPSLLGGRRPARCRAQVMSALVAVPAFAGLVVGQQTPVPSDSSGQPVASARLVAAERYEPVFEQFQKMEPRSDRSAIVRNLTLRRDVIEFHLTEGKLYVATPVAGRAVAAVFVGSGSVSFVPSVAVERRELKRVLGDSTVESRIAAVAFVFTDSTLLELERQVTFGAAGAAGDASGPLHDALNRLVDGRAREVLQPTLIDALLNGWATGFFYAHVKREHGEDLMFMVDPQQEEQIELLRGGRREGQKVQIVCQFKRAQDLDDSTAVADRGGTPLRLGASRIEATIAPGLEYSATATIAVTARRDAVRWARFLLFNELRVDSIRDAAFFRAKQSEELWVRLDTPLRAGETRSLRFVYHGDLIGHIRLYEQLLQRRRPNRYAPSPALDTWLFVKASQTWFPRYAAANPRYADWQAADMDLTFHTPTRYRFASVGRLVGAPRVEGDVETTQWVTERPASEVCFNLGTFEELKIADPRIPPVIVQINAEGHRQLDQLLPTRRDPEKDVGADVANSLAFFTKVFGPPLFERYYASEIPFFYGQAFPGLMYLSVETFQTGDETGSEEKFRAHEMAHQWWGIGVEAAGYRDVWLSEGLAEFSGLWYMQMILDDNEKFFKQLRDRRQAIHARRNDAPPIGLGWRVAQTDTPRDYPLVIYQKGAWVLHMLRNLMIDLPTMREDAFTVMMQDFYQQYRGRHASTQDFQKVVEHHLGFPMDWFFDEWINGTAIPTYILSWRAEPAEGGHYQVQLRVRQEDVPNDFVMPVPLQIEFAGGGHAIVRVTVRGALTERTLDVPAEPKRLELNPLESVLAHVKTEGWH